MSDLCLKCGNPAYLPSDQCDVIWHTEAKPLTDRIEELEAKLAKAVEALIMIADAPSEMVWGEESEVRETMNKMEIIAETTLAELKEENYED